MEMDWLSELHELVESHEFEQLLSLTQSLRASVVEHVKHQEVVILYAHNIAKAVVDLSKQDSSLDHGLILARRLVQILANCAVALSQSNPNSINRLWTNLKTDTVFWCHLLQGGDDKLMRYGVMLLYNCVVKSDESCLELVADYKNYKDILSGVIESLTQEEVPEWSVFLLERLLCIGDLMGAYKDHVSPLQVHLMLDVLACAVDKHKLVDDGNWNTIICMFCQSCALLDDVSQSVFNAPGSETWRVMRQCLNVLGRKIWCDRDSVDTKRNVVLVTVELLHTVVGLGKKGHVLFQPRLDLESYRKLIADADPQDTNPSVLYGLKQDLVRLLGNLVQGDSRLQQLVVDKQIVLLLLDCSKSEAENPLLKEWSVLAISHLCHFQIHRDVIASLTPVNEGQKPPT